MSCWRQLDGHLLHPAAGPRTSPWVSCRGWVVVRRGPAVVEAVAAGWSSADRRGVGRRKTCCESAVPGRRRHSAGLSDQCRRRHRRRLSSEGPTQQRCDVVLPRAVSWPYHGVGTCDHSVPATSLNCHLVEQHANTTSTHS